MTKPVRGRCLCQAVSFEIDPPVKWCVTCHCESCRRQCSAPMTAYLGMPRGKWRWTGKAAKIYRSSPGVERTFCGDCGTPLSFCSQKLSGLMFFYVAAMQDPELFQPDRHAAWEEKLSWLAIADDLPKCNGPKLTPLP